MTYINLALGAIESFIILAVFVRFALRERISILGALACVALSPVILFLAAYIAGNVSYLHNYPAFWVLLGILYSIMYLFILRLPLWKSVTLSVFMLVSGWVLGHCLGILTWYSFNLSITS